MEERTDALALALERSEDGLLAVEYDLPGSDADRAEQPEAQRDRYDEQIYAALVAPSF